jgi:uncharacterized protein YutE (UPF0331/DUF86 family)
MLKNGEGFSMDDVILNKATTIERCLQRIKEEYVGFEKQFKTNYTKQDAILLNVQRACEAAIDMATHVIRLYSLGVPQSSREVFLILEEAKIISANLSQKLQMMVGFRNIAVHNYTLLDLDIVQAVIEKELAVFLEFNRCLLQKI